MAAETVNQDADETLLSMAVEKLLCIAVRALSDDGTVTPINHQQESGVEPELARPSEEPIPKAVRTHQQSSIENSEVRPSLAGYNDIIPGMLVTNAIQGLLFGIEYYGTSRVNDICRGVFNVASALAGRGRNEELDIVMYLEQVLEYMDNARELAGTLLHCHMLHRCANVFTHERRMENAKRALYAAQRIAAGHSDMAHLEMAVWACLVGVHKELGEEQMLQTVRMTFLQICEPRLLLPAYAWPGGIEYSSVLAGVGRVCFDIGLTCNDIKRMEDGIGYLTEALRLEGDQGSQRTRPTRQASLLLQLSECYNQHSGLSTGQHAGLILLEQAIAGYEQVECTCSPYPLSSTYTGTGVIECGRHQRLADALKNFGTVLESQGFMEEAQRSFERGLDLVGECNDRERAAGFHLQLATHLFLKSHGNIASAGYQRFRLGDAPDLSTLLYKQALDHFREFLKKTRPGASFHHDQMAIYARAVLYPPEDLKENTLEKVMAVQEMMQRAEERGDSSSSRAFHHQRLCAHFLRIDAIEACKQHLSLALQSLEAAPISTDMALQILQPLGWTALDAKIEDFDCAYEIWQKVYRATEEMLDNMAQISEEHAFRYFEITKHACMALAKCVFFRANTNNATQFAQSSTESALIWAERGKGRMFMSFIEASIESNDEYLTSHFDKSRFLSDDTFALQFICNRPPRAQSPELDLSQSRKTVFVEYTFLDYKHLMTQIVIDGPGPVSTLHYSGCLCLHCEISEDIQHEAETYLNSVRDSSEGTQNFTTPVPPQSAIHNVLSAMNKYSTNRIPFNPWIPGMVVGFQKHVGDAIEKLAGDPHSPCDKEKHMISVLLRALYAVLIKPIKEKLAAVYEHGRDTLVFVPHEDLGIVPFAALHESEESPRYLIEDYAISISPSIWCTRHCENLYEKIVRFGCEEGSVPVLVEKKSGYPPEYGDLNQAHKEVDAVAEAIGSTVMSTVLKDDELSHARMMEVLPNASWIHLSVHGEVSSQFPQGSLLISDNGSQSRLTAEEIMTAAPSAWRARAVVLSACQTGLGSVAGGGIMGFARSFILAGVPSSVLSMWQAEDRFCSEFMKRLYEQLALGYSLAHAMQKVIIFMMHEQRYKKGKLRKFRELKWSIIQWACFSCLGFPNVVLPNTEKMQPAESTCTVNG